MPHHWYEPHPRYSKWQVLGEPRGCPTNCLILSWVISQPGEDHSQELILRRNQLSLEVLYWVSSVISQDSNLKWTLSQARAAFENVITCLYLRVDLFQLGEEKGLKETKILGTEKQWGMVWKSGRSAIVWKVCYSVYHLCCPWHITSPLCALVFPSAKWV